ncbi:MAG: DnaA N-terminal domain-containing protein [Candidatus Rickettsia vulgarisii]
MKLANLQVEKEILESLITSVYGKVTISYKNIKYSANKTLALSLDVVELHQLDPNSTWYKVRKELGEDIDRAWFSKLKAAENINTQTLTLVASSNFYRDWINNHYGHKIRHYTKEMGYQFMTVEI